MKNTMQIEKNLNAPWSLFFDRDGVEDMAILCDEDGEVMVQSRAFWLPEENGPMPPILAAMQLMKSAPELLDILESLIYQIGDLKGESSVIDEDLMQGDTFKQGVALLASLETPTRDESDAEVPATGSIRRIAAVWSIEDVQEIRPDLDDDQAGQVLQAVEKHQDCTTGITWETLEYHAEMLFGDAPDTNDEEA